MKHQEKETSSVKTEAPLHIWHRKGIHSRASRFSCFVIEDEPLAMHGIKNQIANRSELDLIGVTDDIEIVEDIERYLENLDILFTDVKVAGGEVSKLIPYISPESIVVIVSAYPPEMYPEYLKNVFSYSLWKPFSQEDFNKVVDECINELNGNRLM